MKSWVKTKFQFTSEFEFCMKNISSNCRSEPFAEQLQKSKFGILKNHFRLKLFWVFLLLTRATLLRTPPALRSLSFCTFWVVNCTTFGGFWLILLETSQVELENFIKQPMAKNTAKWVISAFVPFFWWIFCPDLLLNFVRISRESLDLICRLIFPAYYCAKGAILAFAQRTSPFFPHWSSNKKGQRFCSPWPLLRLCIFRRLHC